MGLAVKGGALHIIRQRSASGWRGIPGQNPQHSLFTAIQNRVRGQPQKGTVVPSTLLESKVTSMSTIKRQLLRIIRTRHGPPEGALHGVQIYYPHVVGRFTAVRSPVRCQNKGHPLDPPYGRMGHTHKARYAEESVKIGWPPALPVYRCFRPA